MLEMYGDSKTCTETRQYPALLLPFKMSAIEATGTISHQALGYKMRVVK